MKKKKTRNNLKNMFMGNYTGKNSTHFDKKPDRT